jgi:Cytochrome c554 and c-prime
MRLTFFCVLLLSIAILPYPASAKKAATIDELVEMYNIKPCTECHPDKYEEWKTSTMGNSMVDPRVLRGMRSFIRLALDREPALQRKDLTICLNCHIPQIKDATPELVLNIGDLILTAVENKNAAEREAAKKELSKLNLNCLGCHNLKGTGFKTQPGEKVIYGPKAFDTSPHRGFGFDTIKSDLFTTSEFCAQCHHCPPDVPWEKCPDLYTSYIDDFVKKGRSETCQDCHMEGKKLSHKFLGPDNLDFLKSSVRLTVNARPSRYIDIYENEKMPAVVLQVTIKNHAGHEIPHG